MTHALPPVVLLISIDTLRQDHVGCYGYHRNTTPFLDSLAAKGRRYQRAFTPVPVTLPAHTCIFTARYPGWNNVAVHNGVWLPPTSTWINQLDQAGIQTAGFVSSFVLDQRMTRGFNLRHYDDTMNLAELNRHQLRRRGAATIDACLRWFATVQKDAPIFCFLHLVDVRGTYDVPGPIGSQFVRQHYKEDSLTICEIYSPGGIPDIYRLDKLPDFPGQQVGSYYVDRYDGGVAYVDQQVQRLVHRLVEIIQGPLICIVTSDHGEAFGEDSYWCTHSHGVLPNQTQVPFIIWSSRPEVMAGLLEASKPVSLLDIGPTVLDIFGAADNPKERHHGWSLFDQSKAWDTRRLFSISATQILAFSAEEGEGIVLGAQTTSSHDLVCDVEQQCAYFDSTGVPSTNSVSEAFLFYTLTKSIGSGKKPMAVTFFQRREAHIMAQRLADLGYVENVHADEDIADLSHYVTPLPALLGHIAAQLPRSTAETIARELQIKPALDLGCGISKIPGFFGMDRYPMTGVDVVADLNASLPFPDGSFDLVLASHALEHVQDLLATMQEIYRVCKHGAQVCVVAPYALQGLNLANPYHRQVFNEHTPRFWTNSAHTLVAEAEYAHPHAPSWGLAESDYSQPGIDFRCLRMEFFYFPEYRHLSEAERRAARKKYMDVCDQIMYHLIVVKEPISEAEMQELAQRTEYYDPPYVAMRRLEERLEARETELDQTRATLAASEKLFEQARAMAAEHEAALLQAHAAELAQTRAEAAEHVAALLQAHAAELAQTCAETAEHAAALLQAHAAELAQTRTEAAEHAAALLQAHAAELAQAHAALREHETDLVQVRTTLETRESELAQIRVASQTRETELAHAHAALQTRVAELDQLKSTGKFITAELDAYRQRRIIRWLNRLLNRSDASNEIAPAFQQLKDDSFIFTKGLDGFLLQPSDNLQRVPFLYYPLNLGRANLNGILLAPIVDFPLTSGILGIEMVSPSNTIVAQAVVPAHQISATDPTRFDFAPLRDSDQGRFWLRVFVRDVDMSVRIFEWRKYSIVKLGAVQTRAFCGFVFQV